MEEVIDLTSENEESLTDRHVIIEPIPADISEDISETSDDEVPPTQSGTIGDPIQFGTGKYKNLSFKQVECQRAFDSVLCKSYIPNEEEHDLESVLRWLKKKLQKELPVQISVFHGLRVWVSLSNKYDSINGGKEKDYSNQTHTKLLINEWGIPTLIQNILLELVSKNSGILQNGSDLVYIKTQKITIKLAHWDMGAGRKYKTFPQFLENKRCFVNVKNDDEKCFAYSIAAYLLQREAQILKRNKWQAVFVGRARGDTQVVRTALATKQCYYIGVL